MSDEFYGFDSEDFVIDDAAPTKMLSVELIDHWIGIATGRVNGSAMNTPSHEQFIEILAMARRSALIEAAGKLPEEPNATDEAVYGPKAAWINYSYKVRTHATAIQSKLDFVTQQWEHCLEENAKALFDSIEANRRNAELQSKLAASEAENARLKAHNKVLTDTVTSCGAALCRAEDAETRLREVTAERDALKEQSANEVNWHMQVASELRAQLTAANRRAETAWERAKEACAKAICKHCNAENTPKAGAHYLANEDHYVPCNSIAIHKLKEPANGNG